MNRDDILRFAKAEAKPEVHFIAEIMMNDQGEPVITHATACSFLKDDILIYVLCDIDRNDPRLKNLIEQTRHDLIHNPEKVPSGWPEYPNQKG